jgi:hypothetical protein
MYTGLQAGPSCICGRLPAGDLCGSTGITAGEHSLAGQLPQGDKPSLAEALHLVFVGASLLANRANERSSPQANIRWQASSHKG